MGKALFLIAESGFLSRSNNGSARLYPVHMVITKVDVPVSPRPLKLRPPEAVVLTLEDGCVSIAVGDICGVVSSMHLVEPKINQMTQAWLEREQQKASA